MSRIGNKPISVPDGVKVTVNGRDISAEGPKGKAQAQLHEGVQAKLEENTVHVKLDKPSLKNRALHGLDRSLISNLLTGVSVGFIKELEVQGVGYRAAVQGQKLELSLGFSHTISHPIPEGIKVSVEKLTKIRVEGVDRQLVGQTASEIRRYRVPEPYKGKGVKYVDEQVRRKAGKAAGSSS